MTDQWIAAILLFARRRRVVMFCLAGLLTAISIPLALRVSLDADVLHLLPQNGPAVQGFRAYLDRFGSLDHLYIVFESPEGREIGEYRDFVDAYVRELRRLPEIRHVDAQLVEPGQDWDYVFDRELLLLDAERLAQALDRLRPEGMARELARARELLSVPSAEVKELVRRDPLGLLSLLRDQLGGAQGVLQFDPTKEGYVSRDNRSRLLIADPVRPPFDTEFCRRLFAQLSRVEAIARVAGRLAEEADDPKPPVRVEIAGAHRVSLESEEVIKTEAIAQASGSMLGVLLLTFAVFRNFWILVCATVPLTLGALFTVAWYGVTGERLSAASTGFAAMLFGLGIDGIILLYLRYLEEVRVDGSPELATARLSGTARSMILGNITTAATFYALSIVDFPSLEQMGRLVGLSILISCGLAILLVPALLAVGPRSQGARTRTFTTAWLHGFVVHWTTPILIAAVVLTVGLGAALPRLRVSTGIDKLQPDTPGARLQEGVVSRFSLPSDVSIAISEGSNLDELLTRHQELAALARKEPRPLVMSSAADLLPDPDTQARRARLIAASGLTPESVSRDLRLNAENIGFRPDSFAPFLERLPRLLNPQERLTYQGFIEHGLATVIGRFIVRSGEYMTAAYLYTSDPASLATASTLADRVPGLRLTGVAAVNEELQARFLRQFSAGAGIGIAAVSLMLFVVFRSVAMTLLALLPTALGLVWSAGLLALFGVELDLFSFFAVMTFLGIGVDYGVHLLHRYDRESGRNLAEVLTMTGPAILLAGGSTLISYGTLLGSSYGPLRSLGIMSVTTTATCAIATLLVLPAILVRRRGASTTREP